MSKLLRGFFLSVVLSSTPCVAQLSENVLEPFGNAGIGTELQSPGVLDMVHIHQPWVQQMPNVRRTALRLSYLNKHAFGQLLIEPFNGQSANPRASLLSNTYDLVLRTGADLDQTPVGNIIIASNTRGGAVGITTTPNGPGGANAADILRMLITENGDIAMGVPTMPAPLNIQPVRDKLHVNIEPGPSNNSSDSKGITLTHGAIPLRGDERFTQWAIEGHEGNDEQSKLSSFSQARDVVFRSVLPVDLEASPPYTGYKGNLILTSQRRGSSILFGTSPSGVEPSDGWNPDLERMRITADGAVGIGVTAPAQKLHVNGSLRLSGGLPAPAVGTVIEAASKNRLCIYTNTNGHNGRNFIEMWDEHDPARLGELAFGGTYIDFRTNTNGQSNGNFGRPHVRIAANGNVGIGAVGNQAPHTDNARLEVNSGVGNTSGVRFTNLTSSSPTSPSNGKVLTVDAEGDIILSPALDLGTGTAGFVPKWMSTSSMAQSLLFDNGQTIIVNSSVTPPAAPNPNDPIFRLAVNGSILAHELVVRVDNWPDFVFHKNYHLLSLDSLAKEIELLGHLPDVPSCSEALSGIGLGQMQNTLLRKVEELTLYIIDLQKQIRTLQGNDPSK